MELKKMQKNKFRTNYQKIFKRAQELFKEQKLEKAQVLLSNLIETNHEHIGALKLLGVIALKREEFDKALVHFSKLVMVEPNNAENHFNLGVCLHDQKRVEEALFFYDSALNINPNFVEAIENKAAAFRDLFQFEKALATYSELILRSPKNLKNYSNYAICLTDFGQYETALEMYEIAISLGSKRENYHKAGVLMAMLRDQEALEALELAKNYYEDKHEIDWNLGSIYLRNGLFEKGWEKYESRLKIKGWFQHTNIKPQWNGCQDIRNKTILIQSEQGLGDTIQFCRYLKYVKSLGCKVIFIVQKELLQLLKNLEGADSILTKDDSIPEHDYYCYLLSLPFIFRTTEKTIPSGSQYIKSDKELNLYWKAKTPKNKKLKVGIVWSGAINANRPSEYNRNRQRNIPIEYLLYFKSLDIDLYSLQKGAEAENQLKDLLEKNPDLKINNPMQSIVDFTDTAALIENLDLIVSVDTSTAHLSAALGKETWLLNRFDTCWRWMLYRNTSPWYENMKIYRQEKPNDWSNVVERVVKDIQKRVDLNLSAM
jgi:tetratricopeptide (TPR) repeat protein